MGPLKPGYQDVRNRDRWGQTIQDQPGLILQHTGYIQGAAVVHWNLPTNPVDLEQREGRIHRYNGHAVRKNLAKVYALFDLVSLMDTETDVWEVLFRSARATGAKNTSELSPFWVYPLEGGAKIERHVPALPLSRDQLNLDSLQRSLAIYRMVFGQNRQEDLLAYLVAHFPTEKLKILMNELRVDLSPPH